MGESVLDGQSVGLIDETVLLYVHFAMDLQPDLLEPMDEILVQRLGCKALSKSGNPLVPGKIRSGLVSQHLHSFQRGCGIRMLSLLLEDLRSVQSQFQGSSCLSSPRHLVPYQPTNAPRQQGKEEQEQPSHRKGRPVSPGEFPDPVPRRRRARQNLLVVQVALDIRRECIRCLIAAVTIF